MLLTDLLKGRKVDVMTDAKVVVQLEVETVTEQKLITREVITPDTRENDWWGTSIYHKDIKYIIKFTNGFSKEYSSIEKIPFVI